MQLKPVLERWFVQFDPPSPPPPCFAMLSYVSIGNCHYIITINKKLQNLLVKQK